MKRKNVKFVQMCLVKAELLLVIEGGGGAVGEKGGGGEGVRNFRITGDEWAPRTVHVQTKICRRRDRRASKSETNTKKRFYKSIPTFDSRMFFRGGETADKPELFHIQERPCKAETRPGF